MAVRSEIEHFFDARRTEMKSSTCLGNGHLCHPVQPDIFDEPFTARRETSSREFSVVFDIPSHGSIPQSQTPTLSASKSMKLDACGSRDANCPPSTDLASCTRDIPNHRILESDTCHSSPGKYQLISSFISLFLNSPSLTSNLLHLPSPLSPLNPTPRDTPPPSPQTHFASPTAPPLDSSHPPYRRIPPHPSPLLVWESHICPRTRLQRGRKRPLRTLWGCFWSRESCRWSAVRRVRGRL